MVSDSAVERVPGYERCMRCFELLAWARWLFVGESLRSWMKLAELLHETQTYGYSILAFADFRAFPKGYTKF